MIDFHCHLDLYSTPHDVRDECQRRGLYVLAVTTVPTAWRGTTDLVSPSSRIRVALGLHPQLAHERRNELDLFDSLLPSARYIGEIGLDGSPEYRTSWQIQIAVFEHILRACRLGGGRIMSIHSRRAAGPVLDRIESNVGAGTPILHWFSGSNRELDRAIKLGCWFSVGPAMLKSAKGRDLVAQMPRDRLLTESDGPFAQLDGTSAMPWDVEKALGELGRIWSSTPREAEQKILANLKRLFAICGAVAEDSDSSPSAACRVETVLPDALSDVDLAACHAIIANGGAVVINLETLRRSTILALARKDGVIVGVGALKPARSQYAAVIAQRSGAGFSEKSPELGYIAVTPEHRRKGLSKTIVARLSEHATGDLFATTSSIQMKRTLRAAGFTQRGGEWAGSAGVLSLWISTAADRQRALKSV